MRPLSARLLQHVEKEGRQTDKRLILFKGVCSYTCGVLPQGLEVEGNERIHHIYCRLCAQRCETLCTILTQGSRQLHVLTLATNAAMATVDGTVLVAGRCVQDTFSQARLLYWRYGDLVRGELTTYWKGNEATNDLCTSAENSVTTLSIRLQTDLRESGQTHRRQHTSYDIALF